MLARIPEPMLAFLGMEIFEERPANALATLGVISCPRPLVGRWPWEGNDVETVRVSSETGAIFLFESLVTH